MSADLPVTEPAALGLVLDAPLQSWGVDSRFQRRGTGAHPSRSAVLGLLAAALGIDKHAPDEAGRLEPLRALRLTTCRVPRPGTPGAALAGRLADYHTIGGGYDKGTDSGRLSMPRKAEGGTYPFPVITQREYLTDAVFVAILEGARATLEAVGRALDDPVWGVWLGRKCCLPATPVRATVCADPRAALAQCLAKLAIPAAKLGDFDRYLEFRPTEILADDRAVVDAVADEPVSFGRREHVSRRIIHRRAGQPD